MKWFLYLVVFLILGLLVYWCVKNVFEIVRLIKHRKEEKKDNENDKKE